MSVERIIGNILANRVQNELEKARSKIHLLLAFSHDELLEFTQQFQPKSGEVINITQLEQLKKIRERTISNQPLPVLLVWTVEDGNSNGWLITAARNEGTGHLIVLLNDDVPEKESIVGLKRISANEIETSEIVNNVLGSIQLSDKQSQFIEKLRYVTKCTIQTFIEYLGEVKKAVDNGENLDVALGKSLPSLRLFHDPYLLNKTEKQIEDRLERNAEYSSLAKLENLYERRIISRPESRKKTLAPEKLDLLGQYLENQSNPDAFYKISYDEFHDVVRLAKESQPKEDTEKDLASANEVEASNLLLGLVKILDKYREGKDSSNDVISNIIISAPDDSKSKVQIPIKSLNAENPASFHKLSNVNKLLLRLIEKRLEPKDESINQRKNDQQEDERSVEEHRYLEIDVSLGKETDSYTLKLDIQPDFLQLSQQFYQSSTILSAGATITDFESQIGNVELLDRKSIEDMKKITPSHLSDAVESFVQARQKLIEEVQFGEAISLVGNVEEYVSTYATLLKRINLEEDEEPPVEFIQLLTRLDCVSTQNKDKAVILPFHPLRIRWQYCYEKWLLKILKTLAESPQNYNHVNVELLENVELRGIPPVTCMDRGKLLISSKFVGPYEIYALKSFLTADVHPTLVTKRINDYLQLCPFARRGLRINFVNAGNGDFAFHVLKNVLKDDEEIRIEAYLYGDRRETKLGETFDRESYEHTDITEQFFKRNSNQFLPRLVYLKRYQSPVELSEEKAYLSVLSNLGNFGVSKVDAIGLKDDYAKTYNEADDESLFAINIFSSRYEMISPEPRKIYLVAPNDWLAMHYQYCCVWVERGNPPRGGRAYYTETNLANVEELIKALHEKSDWVIIFDEAIYREYLEVPQRNIKILDVRTGLGTQEAFTMTVSSTNDAIVRQSIGKALEKVFQDDYKPEYEERIFNQSHRLSGKLTLQWATGNENKIHELLGDIIAESATATQGPKVVIPLDDYTEWFEAIDEEDRETRADLLKVSFQDETLCLDIIEAKFMSGANQQNILEVVKKARKQVENTQKIITELFAPKPKTKRLDAELQYERLYHAIVDHNNKQFDEKLLRIIRDGDYKQIKVNTHIRCYVYDKITAEIDRSYLSNSELIGGWSESIEVRDKILSYLDSIV